jgi:hypothetical protein
MASAKRSGGPKILPGNRFGVQIGVPIKGKVDAGWANAFRSSVEKQSRDIDKTAAFGLFISAVRVDGIQEGSAEIRYLAPDDKTSSVGRFLDVIDRGIRDANAA